MSGGIAVLNAGRRVERFEGLKRREEPTRSNVHSVLVEVAQEFSAAELFFAIEQPPQVVPGQQTNAAAITGLWREWGMVVATMDLLEARYTFVPPTSWQTRFWKKKERDALGLDTKEMAQRVAKQFWPGEEFREVPGKDPHGGAIDAALVALWAMVVVFSEEFPGVSDGVE